MLKDEIQTKPCINEMNDILTSMFLFKCKNNNPCEVIVLKVKYIRILRVFICCPWLLLVLLQWTFEAPVSQCPP